MKSDLLYRRGGAYERIGLVGTAGHQIKTARRSLRVSLDCSKLYGLGVPAFRHIQDGFQSLRASLDAGDRGERTKNRGVSE